MAKKSKTQRAKASAARQQRKVAREQEAAAAEAKAAADNSQEESDNAAVSVKKASKEITTSSPATTEVKKKAEDNKPKKKHFQFFRDVRAELRRVTWPSRREVLRWTGVVVVALLFFGIFVAVLDNLVVTPILYGISIIGD